MSRAVRTARRWNLGAMMAIARRDLVLVRQSKAVTIPLIVVPLVMVVALPLLITLLARFGGEAALASADVDALLQRMPPALMERLLPLEPAQQVIVLLLGYMFAPMFLILPLMVSSVIAADTFAGEKERKTLEALLYTPTTDRELYVAKLLAPWAAALATTAIGMLVYTLVVNLIGWPALGRVFFPNLTWVVLVLWVAPAAAGLGLGAMVLVSSRTSTFQEAYQLGSVVVLPVVAILIGQFAGVITFDRGFALALGLALWLIVAVVLWYGIRGFRRVSLLAQL